eukprot:322356-Chlamydomonas_euryale.AAC.1
MSARRLGRTTASTSACFATCRSARRKHGAQQQVWDKVWKAARQDHRLHQRVPCTKPALY